MGLRFSPTHINLVVYTTTPGAEPPNVSRGDVLEFVRSLVEVEPWGMPRLMGRRHGWQRMVVEEAHRVRADLSESHGNQLMPASVLAATLQRLRWFFFDFQLYGLPVSYSPDELRGGAVDSFANFLAHHVETALVLFPSGPMHESAWRRAAENLPPCQLVVDSFRGVPGMLLWTHSGASAFVTEGDGDFGMQLENALVSRSSWKLDAVLDRLGSRPNRKRILHLSDLHFGTESTAANAAHVEAHLADAVRGVDRVVVTGDLFDNPSPRDADDYNRFEQSLERLSGRPVIAIPGNHDQRWLGTVSQTAARLPEIRWSQHVVDDDLRIAFLCFNSSEAGWAARGRVTKRQLSRMAALHEQAMAVKPAVRDYLTLALIHHHVYSFETSNLTWYQRLLSKFGGDEPWLRLDDAERFQQWCARWRVSAVLHGHKHVPRYESRLIEPVGAAPHEVSAIGCGSTFGAEGSPLSYGVLSWNPDRGHWTATFYESRDGGPFIPALVTRVRRPAAAPAGEA